MRQFVVYTRVSTEDQGKSGLGLDAQHRDIQIFLEGYAVAPYEVLGRFCDVLSGADDNRPELMEAIALAKQTGAELLIAKLDRLSRRVAFVSRLMDDAKLKIRVAQMPNADKFQLHIYAALAEQERDFISARTKAALAAAKRRGVKLGGLRDLTMKRNEAVQARASLEARRYIKVIAPLQVAGLSLASIAGHLNAVALPSSRGGTWTAVQVGRVVKRAAREDAKV